MADVIVLAMHGVPPRDYPPQEVGELFGLHMRLEHVRGPEREALQRRADELDARVRAWPRTPENDPFHAGSLQLAARLEEATGLPVIVGFNEFCAPSLDEALEQAAAESGGRVLVVTPMMTRGGEHSEEDIPAAIRRAQARRPTAEFVYAWPFDAGEVAALLSAHLGRHTRPISV